MNKKWVMGEIPGCINNITGGADLLGVKLELENLKQDYITSEQYREICASHHIEKPKLQYDLLNYFKDLGVAYFCESEELNTRLESVRVLNPAWLTNGIYRLILRTRESGFLSHKEIKKTLSAGDNPALLKKSPSGQDFRRGITG